MACDYQDSPFHDKSRDDWYVTRRCILFSTELTSYHRHPLAELARRLVDAVIALIIAKGAKLPVLACLAHTTSLNIIIATSLFSSWSLVQVVATVIFLLFARRRYYVCLSASCVSIRLV